MNPSSSRNIKITLPSPISIGQPTHWRAKRKLGDKWVQPDTKGYNYVFLQFKFSILPSEGLIVPKAELELDINADGSGIEPYIYNMSPRLEEEFILPPVIPPAPQNGNSSITAEVTPAGGIFPIIKAGFTKAFNHQSNPIVTGYLKKKSNGTFPFWRFNSKPLDGIFYVNTIIGTPVDASAIKAKLRISAKVTYQRWFLRMLMNEPYEEKIDYKFSI